MVECTTKDTVIVNYGSTSSYGSNAKTLIISATTASPVTFVHKIKLTGLYPDSRYWYEARQGESVSQGLLFNQPCFPVQTSDLPGWLICAPEWKFTIVLL